MKESRLNEGNLAQMKAISLDGPDLRRFVQTLMDTIAEGLVVISSSGKILAFNRMASAIFGYAADEMIGRNVSTLMPSPHRELHDSYIRSYLETGERKVIGIGRRVLGLHSDGREFPIQIELGEMSFADRRIFLGFIEDLSDKERQRSRIRELSSQLAHASRVSSMGMLGSAVAHEINQPLAAIQNYVETVAAMVRNDETVERETLCEAMEACALEATRAGEIIRRLRQFMSNGEVEHSRESLSNLVGKALALALADGEDMGVEVRLRLDSANDEVLADGVEIEQVVFNLIRNAIQAMEGMGNRHIRISSLADGTMVEVIVEDNGPGLSKIRQKDLFAPFASDKPGGLGLGLMICQAIIEGHGGRIWATQSELGGAAFHFTIPRFPVLRPARND